MLGASFRFATRLLALPPVVVSALFVGPRVAQVMRADDEGSFYGSIWRVFSVCFQHLRAVMCRSGVIV